MSKMILIVDAYSSGNLLAPEFQRHGFDCVHVQSTKEIFPVLKKSFNADDFAANLAFNGDLDALLRQVKKLNIEVAVAGSETGVLLADSISEALSLKTNGTSLSKARRNRSLMMEALHKAGLFVPRTIAAADVRDLIAFKNQFALKRVAVRPCEGTSTESVIVCETDEEVTRAHEAIIGKNNSLGLVNNLTMVEDYLEGNVYFITCVSLNGKHLICDVEPGDKRVSLADEDEVLDYTSRALDALAMRFGPSHCEVMMTAHGPHLIDFEAHLPSRFCAYAQEDCASLGPVSLAVDCYVAPAIFREKAELLHGQNYAMSDKYIATHDHMVL